MHEDLEHKEDDQELDDDQPSGGVRVPKNPRQPLRGGSSAIEPEVEEELRLVGSLR